MENNRYIAALLIFFLFFFSKTNVGQSLSATEEYIILTDTSKKESILNGLQKLYPSLSFSLDQLIPGMNYYSLVLDQAVPKMRFIAALKKQDFILEAQEDHKIALRHNMASLPNDTLIQQQWQYVNTNMNPGTPGVDLDADLAWDISTGGVNARGDTIVVAILDNGISPFHEDFEDNLWINHAEIPNNGIDDDQNGYIDDHKGWNSLTNDDLIAGGSHGTSVAGIIGAKGNNTTGVSGVNWNVKMMIIRNDWNSSESNVLSAYGYALNQRKLYNSSNGLKGAYVVCTNASWGVDFGQPSSAPLWCSFYDSLGKYGILNVAATANQNIDVDIVGDLPTACSSPYLISVTNVNNQGQKESNAAFGLNSIDLGAFGSAVYTCSSPNGYGPFGGTSGASPHVAGAIALMHSAACFNFSTLDLIYPDSAALLIKKNILDGVVPVVDLNNNSVSGGYLNLFNALTELNSDCPDSCFSVYDISHNVIGDSILRLAWKFPPLISYTDIQYSTDLLNWIDLPAYTNDSLNLFLSDSCTNFTFRFISSCSNDTLIYSLNTLCCNNPFALGIQHDSTGQSIEWQDEFPSQNYIITLLNLLDSTQLEAGSDTLDFLLDSVALCTPYLASVRSVCATGDTISSSDSLYFYTLGCEDCMQLPYCSSAGLNSAQDWIDSFSIGQFGIKSGNNSGYLLVDSLEIALGSGNSYDYSISKDNSFIEFFKIWIDLNQNGLFDANELLADEVMSVVDRTFSGSISIPSFALAGNTRMRVAMRWQNPPEACMQVDYGEVEDYCIQIATELNSNPLIQLTFDAIVYPNPSCGIFHIETTAAPGTLLDISLHDLNGRLIQKQSLATHANSSIQLSPNLAPGIYFVKIKNNKKSLILKLVRI